MGDQFSSQLEINFGVSYYLVLRVNIDMGNGNRNVTSRGFRLSLEIGFCLRILPIRRKFAPPQLHLETTPKAIPMVRVIFWYAK